MEDWHDKSIYQEPNLRTPRESQLPGHFHEDKIPIRAWIGGITFVAGCYVFIKLAVVAGFF